MKKLIGFLILFISLFISSNAYSGTISFDQLAVSADLTVSKWNADMDLLYREFNSNVESSNIAADTLAESDMADEINPRIRTNEAAACEFIASGMLTVTTAGTLTGNVPVGTAYPRGFRCRKDSATSKTFTSSRLTFVDIDQNCDFQYSEVAIDAASPAVATNAIRISRVSTDGTQLLAVQDLRKTSCATGPFDNITDTTSEANLDQILSLGRPTRNRGTDGWLQGLQISYDTTTTFKVRSGGAYINNKYRVTSVDITVPQTADNPAQGTSGIDTGAIATSTRYNVFALADQSEVSTLSVSFGTGTTPNGGTNSRKIGEIRTDTGNRFSSSDILVTNGIYPPSELASGWVVWNGVTAGAPIIRSFNVSSMIDTAAGDFTITWDKDFVSNDYVVAGTCGGGGLAAPMVKTIINYAETSTSSTHVFCRQVGDVLTDTNYNAVIAFGEQIQES